MSALKSNDAKFRGYQATRIGDYPVDANGVLLESSELITAFREKWASILPDALLDTSRHYKNENNRFIEVILFNYTSTNGMIASDIDGVWLLTGGNRPWAAVQRLNLEFFINDGKLTIHDLK